MAVSKRLRYEIFRRDNFQCRYCGAKPPDTELRPDHVIPRALGGKDEPENLVAACVDCNAGKSSVPSDTSLVEDVRQDALRWARALSIATTGARVERAERNERREAFYRTWADWNYESGGKRYLIGPLPAEWKESVDAFWRAGLDQEDLGDAVDIAMRRSRIRAESLFKYFCGICWRMIQDRREAAAALVDLVPTEEGEILSQMRAIVDGAAGRDLTEDEAQRYEELEVYLHEHRRIAGERRGDSS